MLLLSPMSFKAGDKMRVPCRHSRRGQEFLRSRNHRLGRVRIEWLAGRTKMTGHYNSGQFLLPRREYHSWVKLGSRLQRAILNSFSMGNSAAVGPYVENRRTVLVARRRNFLWQ